MQVDAVGCKSAEVRDLALRLTPSQVQQNAPACRKNGSVLGPPMLTVGEVAAILRVSTATVYKAIRAGMVPAVRVVGQFRIALPDVERLTAGHLGS